MPFVAPQTDMCRNLNHQLQALNFMKRNDFRRSSRIFDGTQLNRVVVYVGFDLARTLMVIGIQRMTK